MSAYHFIALPITIGSVRYPGIWWGSFPHREIVWAAFFMTGGRSPRGFRADVLRFLKSTLSSTLGISERANSGDRGVKRRPVAALICFRLPVRKHFLHGTISLDGRPCRRTAKGPRRARRQCRR